MKVGFDTKLEGGEGTGPGTKELLELIRVIKQRLSYGRVFSHYGLGWRGDGDHQLSCPFHGADRNPSCHYYANDRRIWCFTCAASGDSGDAGGDVVWFVKKHENLPTMFAAVQRIEQVFGITGRRDLLDRMHDDEADNEEKRKLRLLHSQATSDRVNDVLHILHKSRGENVRLDNLEYMLFEQKRKIDQSTLPHSVFLSELQRWYNWCVEMIRKFEVSGGN